MERTRVQITIEWADTDSPQRRVLEGVLSPSERETLIRRSESSLAECKKRRKVEAKRFKDKAKALRRRAAEFEGKAKTEEADGENGRATDPPAIGETDTTSPDIGNDIERAANT